MSSEVKCKMIFTYCCHYYGSEVWDLTDIHFKYVLTTWNIAVRQAWDLPYDSHTYLLPVIASHSARDIIYSKFLSFYSAMCNSKNKSVDFICNVSNNDKRTVICRNKEKICKDWNAISVESAKVPDYLSCYNEEQLHCINSLIEINHCFHGFNNLAKFHQNELKDLYVYFATC